jgi:hypothetical protein
MPKSKTRFRMPRRTTAARTCDPCRVCNTLCRACAGQSYYTALKTNSRIKAHYTSLSTCIRTTGVGFSLRHKPRHPRSRDSKGATAQLVFLTSHLSTASQTTKSVILSEAKDLSVQF